MLSFYSLWICCVWIVKPGRHKKGRAGGDMKEKRERHTGYKNPFFALSQPFFLYTVWLCTKHLIAKGIYFKLPNNFRFGAMVYILVASLLKPKLIEFFWEKKLLYRSVMFIYYFSELIRFPNFFIGVELMSKWTWPLHCLSLYSCSNWKEVNKTLVHWMLLLTLHPQLLEKQAKN